MDIEQLCKDIKDKIEKNQVKLDGVTKEVTEVKVALLGLDGNSGILSSISSLIKRQDNLEKNHDTLKEDHTTLNLKFYALVAFLVGSGALGGSWVMGWI